MSKSVETIKPIFLTEEEALAVLDMCLASPIESDAAKDRAMLKVTDLIRRYIIAAELPSVAQPAPSSASSASRAFSR